MPAAIAPAPALPTDARLAAGAEGGLGQASAPSPGFSHSALQLSRGSRTLLTCSTSFGYF